MKTALQQQQKLNFSMTPELRQAIELLQYSTADLEQYIRQQELENPLIELEEKNDTALYTGEFPRSFRHQDPEMPAAAAGDMNADTRDFLYGSAKLTYADPTIRHLLKFLIYSLDDNGYLGFSSGDAPFSEDHIEEGIHLLQKIGPPGVGARNLRECLLLQIRSAYPEKQSAIRLVENHLDLLADRKWKELSSAMQLSLQEIKEIHQFIQTLHPKPCSFASGFSAEYLTPDIIVETVDGELSFKLNDDHLPRIQISSHYSPTPRASDETARYINSQFQRYQWLLSSIEQRRNTIIKIVKVLLDKQEGFFKHGFQQLNPLTLKEVAEEIDMHESTVSRAISNKVMQTAFGIFELKRLFPSKLTSSEGISISQTHVKSVLQKFISQEDKHKPYSDQKIADHFDSCEGIPISRRTISKYREELKIPSASRRKEI